MNYLKTAIIAFIIVVLTINFLLLQIGFFIQRTIIEPSFYDSILQEQQFYGQIRQYVLKMSKENLRFGQQGLPYLEAAITEPWLRGQMLDVANELADFIKGDRDDIPIIPMYRIKERVTDQLLDNRSEMEKRQLVQYWFDPLMDDVRFSYFTTTDVFWTMRWFAVRLRYMLIILLTTILLFYGILLLITSSLKQALLWFVTGITASAGVMMGLALAMAWYIGYSSVSHVIIAAMTEYGLPPHSIEGLLRAFSTSIIFSVNLMAIPFLLLGLLTMHLLPLCDDDIIY